MSTRGLIGFVHQGEVRAKYNHFDSYPEELGQNIVDFCNTLSKKEWANFTEQYMQIEWGEQEVTDSLDTYEGASILPVIQAGKVASLYDEKDFAEDTLFCEYAYLLNLDSKELEMYSQNYHTGYDQSNANLPMNLLASYPLDNIPSHWQEFIEMRSRVSTRSERERLDNQEKDISDDLER